MAAPAPLPLRILQRVTSAVDPIDLSAFFAAPQPTDLELGSGDGSFLIEYATAHPERNFLGVERLMGRIRKIERRGLRLGLRNLAAIRFEAAYLLQYLLPAAAFDAVHIYFPDPWPKLKHRRHRLVNEAFPGLLSRILRLGGTVHMRTDDQDYFAQMVRVFEADPRFTRLPTPEELAAVRTDFEREFNARGIPTLRLSARMA
jgi:tRNA (guanine-N7-)-methyltransferase